jgi:DNA-directed RNA polymerase beta' subunit/intein/homing endonuclease
MDKFTKSEAPLKLIVNTEFGILAPDVIKKMSVAEIEYVEMFENKMPKIGSLCDPRMGCINQNMTCYTCEENYNNCPGHFGHINLAAPVYHIGFLKTIKKVLECICHKCSRFRLLPSDARYKKLLTVKNKFQFAWDYCKTKTVCQYDDCEAQILPLRKYGLQLYYDVKKSEKSASEKVYLFADTARDILEKITDETCNLIGLNPKTSRPEWMIITVLAVPPPCIRPAVQMDMGDGRGEDDLTHVLTNIIKFNNELKKNQNMRSNNNIYAKNMEALQYNVVTYFDNDLKTGIKQNTQRGSRPIKSITSRLKGKEGRIRGNIMGKRVDFSARTVITGDPTLSIGELGVPRSIAANLTFPEKVNDINLQKMQSLVDNSPEYPSAKYLLKKSGVRIDLRFAKKKPIVQIGDTIDRQLVDGDLVLFNRQPTLHKMSMMAHKIVVMPYSTFRLNVNVCSSYNADFDGDEMNVHAPQSIECIAELSVLSSVENLLVSAQANKPVNSLVQDSITAIRKFTQRDLFIDHTQIMDLMMILGTIDIPPPCIIKPTKLWSGKQIMSILLPKGLNFVGFHSAHPDSESKQDDLSPSDTKVVIKNGTLISGIICKKTVGTSSGGIVHLIFNDYGPEHARTFLDNTSQLLNQWLIHHGFSVGIGDALITHDSQDKMKSNMESIQKDIEKVLKDFKDGTLARQGNLSMNETKENKIQSLLAKIRDDAGRIVNTASPHFNNVKQMVLSGAKGSIMNICQISACVGQQVVEGKRLPLYFKNRTLPHFPEFDDSPESRGFVQNSFLKGLNPHEVFFHAMGGREGVIDTAVKSVSYDTKIIIIENNKPKYVQIGEWIDYHMESKKLDIIHHGPDKMNMELLNLNNVLIPTMNEKGNVSWGDLTSITRHDPGEAVYEIKTYSGRNVTVAKSKSLLIWNSELKEFIEKDTLDVNIGDYVPVNQYLPSPPLHIILNSVYMGDYFPKHEYIHGTEFNKAVKLMNNAIGDKDWWSKNNEKTFTTPYNSKALLKRASTRSADILDGYIYPFHASRLQSKIFEYFSLNQDNGIFIGLFLADGDSHNSSVRIHKNDDTVRNWIKKWFDSHFINYDEYSRKNKWGTSNAIRGHSKFLATFLDTILGHGSKHKYIPDIAFCANQEFIKGIIEGYFSGDGTIGTNNISACSVSKRLIEGISSLLNRFGIFGRIRITHLKSNNLGTDPSNILPAYILDIRGQWATKFSETFSLILPGKNQKLVQLLASEKHRNFDTQFDVVLDKIIEINRFGVDKYPKLYDVTVPSTLNFCLANGLEVRDTASTGK